MWPNAREAPHLVTFNEETLYGKLHFSQNVAWKHCIACCEILFKFPSSSVELKVTQEFMWKRMFLN